MPKDKSPDNETDLFRRMMSDVKPIKADERIQPEKPRLSPRRRTISEEDDNSSSFAEFEHATYVAPEETLFFARTGLQHKIVKKLKRGEVPIEARLDLHGQNIEEAGQSLDQFLEEAQAAGCRCVIIVHGKGHRSHEGKPVLKSQVNYWLRECPMVLAFSSAQPRDGGTGAVYVLLKKIA
jgi:DNA-nicking Smr family endonuclease